MPPSFFRVPSKQRIPQKLRPPPRISTSQESEVTRASLLIRRGGLQYLRALFWAPGLGLLRLARFARSRQAERRRAQVRRGGAELRATLGALREAGPSDRSGHRGRGLYDTALAGGIGRSQWRRRRPPGTERVSADFSRNPVARISKSRACALQRRPAARLTREGDLASVKAGSALSPCHHEWDLSEDCGDRSRGKGHSRRFPAGPSITSAAPPLLRCFHPRRQGLVSDPSPPIPIAPSVKTCTTASAPYPCSPLPEVLLVLGFSASVSQLLCSASHIPHPALGQYSLWCSARVSTLFQVFLVFSEPHDFSPRLRDLITYFKIVSHYSLPTRPFCTSLLVAVRSGS